MTGQRATRGNSPAMPDTLIARIRRRINENREHGASAVEYGLLVAAIAALVVVAVFAIGNWTNNSFTETCDQLDAVNANPACNEAPAP
jgi:pilus assembly protein Flp/PilA